jgi:hypothetical protein
MAQLIAPSERVDFISQRFGERPEVYSRFGYPGHNGIDIAYSNGIIVWAVDDGEVAVAGFDYSGYGNWVELRHSWGKTRYAHGIRGSTYDGVVAGATVVQGQPLFRGDATGFADGPHLHLEMHLPGYPVFWVPGYRDRVDPLPFMPKEIGGQGLWIGDDVDEEIAKLQDQLRIVTLDGDQSREDKMDALVDLGDAIRINNRLTTGTPDRPAADADRMRAINKKWVGRI